MQHEEFNDIFEQRVSMCRDTLVLKAAEYATDDRLHNFKVAGAVQGVTPQAALGGMLAKHIVSIFDLIRSEKPVSQAVWDEKLGDALNYLFLLNALIIKEATPPTKGLS
jgi:hypothetical protein